MAEAVALQGSARTRPSKTPESAHFPSCDDRRHLAAHGVEHVRLQVWAVPLQPRVA